MKIKTNELHGAALDWAVAQCEGYKDQIAFSTCWEHGGPIIEREGITIGQRFAPKFLPKNSPLVVDWTAQYFQAPHSALEVHRQHGPTPLIAAMRCYVASKLGDEVDVPNDLTL